MVSCLEFPLCQLCLSYYPKHEQKGAWPVHSSPAEGDNSLLLIQCLAAPWNSCCLWIFDIRKISFLCRIYNWNLIYTWLKDDNLYTYTWLQIIADVIWMCSSIYHSELEQTSWFLLHINETCLNDENVAMGSTLLEQGSFGDHNTRTAPVLLRTGFESARLHSIYIHTNLFHPVKKTIVVETFGLYKDVLVGYMC